MLDFLHKWCLLCTYYAQKHFSIGLHLPSKPWWFIQLFFFLPTYLPTSNPLAFTCVLTTNHWMQLSMLGGSLVFMIIIGSKYEIVLKYPIRLLFKNLFSYFQNSGRVSKNLQKIISPRGFKAMVFRHVIPISFQSWFLHISYHKFYYIKI